jgi:hypothetical protein
MAIRTIFRMVEDCARGERLGWMEFVRDYAGIARSLLSHYFPTLIPGLDEHVVAVFRRAGAQVGFWFAGLKFTNEREFLMAFRELVFAYGREQERLPAPEITLDQLRSVVADRSLLEREMLWLIIKGYDAPRIAAIIMNAAATAEAVQRIADERLRALIPAVGPDVLAAARVLMRLAEQGHTEQCASLKTFNNLVNGQITWRERELAEEHMTACFHCIDCFTTFQEMVRMRKDAAALPAPKIESILAQLPFASTKNSSIFSRLFASR